MLLMLLFYAEVCACVRTCMRACVRACDGNILVETGPLGRLEIFTYRVTMRKNVSIFPTVLRVI